MKSVILKEQEIKNNKGEVVGHLRISIDEDGIKELLTNKGKLTASLSEKETAIKEAGWTNEDLQKMKDAELI